MLKSTENIIKNRKIPKIQIFGNLKRPKINKTTENN